MPLFLDDRYPSFRLRSFEMSFFSGRGHCLAKTIRRMTLKEDKLGGMRHRRHRARDRIENWLHNWILFAVSKALTSIHLRTWYIAFFVSILSAVANACSDSRKNFRRDQLLMESPVKILHHRDIGERDDPVLFYSVNCAYPMLPSSVADHEYWRVHKNISPLKNWLMKIDWHVITRGAINSPWSLR